MSSDLCKPETVATSTVDLCWNGTSTTRAYLGNSGNVASGIYNLRVRLSTTPPMQGYPQSANVAASFTHSLNPFSQGTFDLAFRVPAPLPNGAHCIYAEMNHTRTISEIVEGGHSAVSAKRVRVACQGRPPCRGWPGPGPGPRSSRPGRRRARRRRPPRGDERAAPPDSLRVATTSGLLLTGAEARLDIKYGGW